MHTVFFKNNLVLNKYKTILPGNQGEVRENYRMEIKREDIISRLNDRFINDDTVYAFWLEGADAIGTIDSYSDLDIWFDIKDGFEDLFIKQLKNALSNISSIDFFYEKEHVSHS